MYMQKKTIFILVLILIFPSFHLLSQTSPEDFLGHKIGADRKLADYKQIKDYFLQLDEESNKITVLNIGESTLDKQMILAVITSEENMARLDEFKTITKKLRDARNIDKEEALRLADQGKIIVLITCNLHSTEIASSQMAMEFAYKLVTGDTPFDSNAILNDVIVLLCPSSNPDGTQMVTEWYQKYLGTKYEGGSMPWLYHHYAGHDDNRDWYMFNLKETKAITKVLYHDWVPQIHIDEHQMGSTGARLFIPPFMDPPIPNVHPLLWRSIALCGMNMAYDLQKNNFKGVVHGRSFTGWYIGACDDTSWLHNTIGILSEMASVKMATPIYIEPTELPESYIDKRMQFPDPWPGGWWRLRDIVDYELTLSMSLVKTAYLHKKDILFNFYKMCKDSIEKQEKGQPYAFIIPKSQRDYPTTVKMLKVLMFGGTEIHQAQQDFVADGKNYPAGSYVVLMSQPYRPFAQAILEKQDYPDMRQYPGGPPTPPYDNAGWTLPLQMGVKCDQINTSFKAELTKLDKVVFPEITMPEAAAPYLLLDSKENASYSVIFPLLQNKAEIYRTRQGYTTDDGIHGCKGSFLVKNTPDIQKILPELLNKWHVEAYGLQDISTIPKDPLKRHRVALYQSWRSNMDEGWTRYVFDDHGIPFTTLHNADFKGKKKEKVDLISKFDVIVFADENTDIILTGKPSPTSPYARYYSGNTPPDYEGGIEKEGVEALKTFVEKGGILVTLNNACGLIFKEFKPPVSNALERVDRTKFFCPSSLLKIDVDNSTPIGYGMPAEAAALFNRSLGLNTRIPSGEWERKVVAHYPRENILLSGWLLGEEVLARKAAVVDLTYKKGHIILIGFRCQHRAQSHGTFKFLFNALLYPEM